MKKNFYKKINSGLNKKKGNFFFLIKLRIPKSKKCYKFRMMSSPSWKLPQEKANNDNNSGNNFVKKFGC